FACMTKQPSNASARPWRKWISERGPRMDDNTLLIDDRAAARLAGISRSTLHALRAAGKWGPVPIRLGRAVRFDRDEVIAWIRAKCPHAVTWRAMQAAESRRVHRNVT